MPYAGEGLEAHVMPLHRLDVVFASESSVSIHDECDMLGHRPLPKGANEQLAQLADGPGDGRRVCNPFGYAVLVERRHRGRLWMCRIFRMGSSKTAAASDRQICGQERSKVHEQE